MEEASATASDTATLISDITDVRIDGLSPRIEIIGDSTSSKEKFGVLNWNTRKRETRNYLSSMVERVFEGIRGESWRSRRPSDIVTLKSIECGKCLCVLRTNVSSMIKSRANAFQVECRRNCKWAMTLKCCWRFVASDHHP